MEPMTPEEYQMLLQLGTDNSDLQETIKMQLAQAEALRRGGGLGMRDAGRMTVAPHWLELVGQLAREGVAYNKQESALADRKKMGANTQMQNNLIMQGILARPKAQPAPFSFQAPQQDEDPYSFFRIGGNT